MAEVERMTGRRYTAAETAVRRRKRRRRGKRTLHYILITFFLMAAGVALSMTVFFKVDSITVVGSDKYPPDELIAASGIEKGQNLFRVNTGEVRDSLLKKYPYIDDVAVRLKLPHEIRLEVTQCVPAGALRSGDEFLIITRGGKVLERGLVFIPEDIPLIRGVETGNAQPGDMLAKDPEDLSYTGVNDALRMLEYLFKAVAETGFDDITNVDLTDPYNMKIVYENRLLLNLGTESELPAKLNFLKEMIENRLPSDAQGLIDASNMGKSLIYTEMTLEEAERGEKGSARKAAGVAAPEADKPAEDVDEPE